jgi:hypothetical protein
VQLSRTGKVQKSRITFVDRKCGQAHPPVGKSGEATKIGFLQTGQPWNSYKLSVAAIRQL